MSKINVTTAQFDALAKLLRLRGGPSQEAARLVLVDGLSVLEAARATSLDLRLAHRAIKNARAGVKLVWTASGVQDAEELNKGH